MKRVSIFLMSILMFIVVNIPILASDKGIQILFIHDLHDNYLARDVNVQGEVVEQGGYARLFFKNTGSKK